MFLHYIWMDFKNELNRNPSIPQDFLSKIENCRKINSDLEVKIWNGYDCRQLLVEDFPDYLNTYDSLPKPIMKCDMIRFFILYKYGGFYMDMDRTCLKPLSQLLSNNPDVILGAFRYLFFNFYNNDFLYSKPGSDFMKRCMENIKISHAPTNSLRVLLTAGPLYLMIQKLRYNGPDKIKVTYGQINGCDICKCNSNLSQASSFPDYTTTSWTDSLDNVFRWFYCNFYLIISILIIVYLLRKLYFLRKISPI